MAGQQFVEVHAPFLFTAHNVISLSGFFQPVRSFIIVLSTSTVHNGFCLLSTSLNRPIRTRGYSSIHHALYQRMTRVWLQCRDRIINQPLVQEHIYLPLWIGGCFLTGIVQQNTSHLWPLLSSSL